MLATRAHRRIRGEVPAGRVAPAGAAIGEALRRSAKTLAKR